ncbi:MAG: hypothetical protein NTV33_02490 [Coprothermobacterota bacterium]|nr:hypothetical protein [Coprothermobacterota bacterium]
MLGDFRDVAIIILAAVSLISLGLMVALFLAVLSLLRHLRADLQPILANGKATMQSVRGMAAAFQSMAEPMQQFLSTLLPLTRIGRTWGQVSLVWGIIRGFLRR